MKFKIKYLAAALVAATLSLPAAAVPPDHANASANASANGRPGGGSGLIVPNRHVYYPGDTLQVRVVYPRSLTAIWSGDAESHIVINVPGDASFSVPLTTDTPDSVVSLVELTDLDTSVLSPGDYQLGLVLTNPGGDPLNLGDWYQGFRGLLSIERVRFSDVAPGEDPDDLDGDGELDDDADGDGFGDTEPLGEAEEDDDADDGEGDDADGEGDDATDGEGDGATDGEGDDATDGEGDGTTDGEGDNATDGSTDGEGDDGTSGDDTSTDPAV